MTSQAFPSGVVTFLFTDIVNSTPLWEMHPNAMQSALEKHDFILQDAVLSNRGTLVKNTGDGTLAVFTSPSNACTAAISAQQMLQGTDWGEIGGLFVRMGIHSGEAQQREKDYYGSTVNKAARIMSIGSGGQILFSQATRELLNHDLYEDAHLENLGAVRLKGFKNAVQISQILVPGLLQDFAPLHSAGYLPRQATPFIGRNEERSLIRDQIVREKNHFISILGPGGMGKSRLAIEIGRENQDHFQHGAYFVDLAPLQSPEEIPNVVAKSLEIQLDSADTPEAQVLNYLSNKNLLLILDNFEHLLGNREIVNKILDASQGVTVLATSRERLNLHGETIFTLNPMDFPAFESPEDALAYTAVQLFLSGAKQVRMDFNLEPNQLDPLVRICRIVGGYPLGLLLAAGWVDTLSLGEIAEELQNSLDLLESDLADLPERHRSMQATFNYSWRLLSDGEQHALAAMSVFRGGFTRNAVQAVTGASLRMLHRLVNKSLIRRDGETGRFEMHELLRQFAEAELEKNGRKEAILDTHAEYYLGKLAERKQALQGGDQVIALEEITQDFENVKSAWFWAVSKKNQQALLAALEPIRLYCKIRSLSETGVSLFEAALKRAEFDDSLLGKLLVCFHEELKTDYILKPESLSVLNQVVNSISKFKDLPAEAEALRVLGHVRMKFGLRDGETVRILERSLDLFDEIGERYKQARVLEALGFCMIRQGDRRTAQKYGQKSLEIRRDINDLYGMASIMNNLSIDIDKKGQESYHEEIYKIRKQIDHKQGIAWSAAYVARAAIHNKKMEKAKRFLYEAFEIIDEINHPQTTLWVVGVAIVYWMVLEEYSRVSELLERGENLPINRPEMLAGIPAVRVFLSISQGDMDAARKHVKNILPFAGDYQANGWILLSLSLILELERRYELALEYATWGLSVVAMAAPTPPVVNMLERLKAQLPEDAYQTAIERGKSLDSKTAILKMKAEGYL